MDFRFFFPLPEHRWTVLETMGTLTGGVSVVNPGYIATIVDGNKLVVREGEVSPPAILDIEALPTGIGIDLVDLIEGLSYTVQRSTSPAAGATWNGVESFVAESSSTNWTDPSPPWPSGFYRAVVE
jgi:hypothetical protein